MGHPVHKFSSILRLRRRRAGEEELKNGWLVGWLVSPGGGLDLLQIRERGAEVCV